MWISAEKLQRPWPILTLFPRSHEVMLEEDSTEFHTRQLPHGVKPQVKVSHDMNSLTLTLYRTISEV